MITWLSSAIAQLWQQINTMGVYPESEWDQILASGYRPSIEFNVEPQFIAQPAALTRSLSNLGSLLALSLLCARNSQHPALTSSALLAVSTLSSSTSGQSSFYQGISTAQTQTVYSISSHCAIATGDDGFMSLIATNSVGYETCGVSRFTAEGNVVWSKVLFGSPVQDNCGDLISLPDNDFVAAFRINPGRVMLSRFTLDGEAVYFRATATTSAFQLWPKRLLLRENGRLVIVAEATGTFTASSSFSTSRYGVAVIEVDSDSAEMYQDNVLVEPNRDFYIESAALHVDELLMVGRRQFVPSQAMIIRYQLDTQQWASAQAMSADIAQVSLFAHTACIMHNNNLHVASVLRADARMGLWFKLDSAGVIENSQAFRTDVNAAPIVYAMTLNNNELLMSGLSDSDLAGEANSGFVLRWQQSIAGLDWLNGIELTETGAGSGSLQSTFSQGNGRVIALGRSRRLHQLEGNQANAISMIGWMPEDNAECFNALDLVPTVTPSMTISLVNYSQESLALSFSTIGYQFNDIALIPTAQCGDRGLKQSVTPVTDDSASENTDGSKSNVNTSTLPIMIGAGAAGVFALATISATAYAIKRRRQAKRRSFHQTWQMQPTFTYIQEEKLQIGQRLGRGGFGAVYYGRYDDREVAIKRVSEISETTLDELKQEATLMRNIKHTNLIEFIGIAVGNSGYSIVMEYAPRGSVFDWLRLDDEITIAEQLQVALDTSQGLAFLHSQNILHRDIKSMNVLLMSNGSAKLADFGLSKETELLTASKTQHRVGTLQWMAPELLQGQPPSAASDIFSLAIFFWELTTRQLPYRDLALATLSDQVIHGLRPLLAESIADFFKPLIVAAWDANPAVRPSASALVASFSWHQQPSHAQRHEVNNESGGGHSFLH